jgi:RNA polymerase sigma-70 factor (ECF subfamily)
MDLRPLFLVTILPDARFFGCTVDRSSEQEIVGRLKRGDTAAFDQIYALYRPRLFGFLVRMAQQRELAEDLLQETWLRLARHAPQLADDTRLDSWLFTVARNLYRSHVRWTIVDIEYRRWLKRTAADGIENTSPFDLTAAGQLERNLEHALATLPAKYREVLLLVAVERMDQKQAAEVLRIRPDALRKRLSRAREMLTEQLGLLQSQSQGQGREDNSEMANVIERRN